MKKSDLQKQFEEEQGREAVAEIPPRKFYLSDYGEWCERKVLKLMDKAEAYDRLMGMNSISENDIQIVLDGNTWCAYRLPFRNLQEDNAGFGDTPQMALTALLESELPDRW